MKNVSVSNGVQNPGFNETIRYKINRISSAVRNNPELQNVIINRIAGKKVLENYEHNYNVSNIDINYELEMFINTQFSEHTKVTYRNQINKFLKYCLDNEIDVLTINVYNVDSYMTFLGNHLSPRTVRNNIMSVNSFFKFMIYRYPECFKVNPFRDRKLPKITDVRKKDFCTISDVRELKKEFKRINRQDIITVIELICKYGFRVGIFSEMKIDKEGNWTSESKGRDYKGKFLKSELEKIKENKILELKTSTIQNIIQKYSKKLFSKGIITCQFSVHDLRRLYIRINLNECKNGTEILNFSRKIHKSLSTTIGYL